MSDDVAQRPQVVLDRLELADRDARERGVLAVGGEHPRVVGEAGADPARARDRPRGRRVLLALVASSGSAGPRRRWVRSARFCLPQSTPLASCGSPGSDSLVRAAQPLAPGDLRRELRRPGRRARAASSVRAAARPLSEPATATHSVSRRPRGHGHLVAQLAALALAERAVVALARAAPRRRRRRSSPWPPRCRGVAGLARGRARGSSATSAAQSCVSRVRVRQLALLAEDERVVRRTPPRPPGCCRAFGLVAAEAPRVCGQQLGVGVDLDRDRALAAPGLRILQPEQRGAPSVGSEVRAAEAPARAVVGRSISAVAPAAA